MVPAAALLKGTAMYTQTDNDDMRDYLRAAIIPVYLAVTRDANSGMHDASLILFRKRLASAMRSLALDPKKLDELCPVD